MSKVYTADNLTDDDLMRAYWAQPHVTEVSEACIKLDSGPLSPESWRKTRQLVADYLNNNP